MGSLLQRPVCVLAVLILIGCAEADIVEAPPLASSQEVAETVRAQRATEEVPDSYERDPARISGAFVAGVHQQALRLRGGHGIEADPGRAAQMFENACEDDFLPSCLALSEMLSVGEGIAQDPGRAHALLEQACFAGSRVACDQLGH